MTSNDAWLVQADKAVRAVLDGVYAAWADNDADGLVASYAEDATALLPGTYLQNKEAVRATMKAAFAGSLKGSTGSYDVQSLRFLGTEAAIVISKGAILLAGEAEPAPENRALETWVLAEEGGEWLVKAFSNCPENAP